MPTFDDFIQNCAEIPKIFKKMCFERIKAVEKIDEKAEEIPQ